MPKLIPLRSGQPSKMEPFAKKVTMEDFDDIMEKHSMVILDFWAEWCAPCKVFAPIFEQLAELNGDIFFGKVNSEEASDLAQAFQIRAIPTIIAFKSGEIIFEHSGLMKPAEFSVLLEQLRKA